MKFKKVKVILASGLIASANVFAQTPNSTTGYVSTIQPPEIITEEILNQRCPPGSSPSTRLNCVQVQQQQYQQQLAAYEAAKRQEATWLAQQQSALQSAQQADQATKSGAGSYQTLQMITQIASVAAAARAASCPPGTCQPVFIAISVAMAGLSMLSAGEKDKMIVRQGQACVVASQLSSGTNNCGAPPPTFNPSNYPVNLNSEFGNVLDASGNCTASPDVCQQITSALPPGVRLADAARGAQAFASGKGPFKVNPDGSITTKDGKTFKPGDLDSFEELVAAGVSPDLARSTIDKMNGIKSGLASIDTKEALAKSNAVVGFDEGGAGGGASGKATAGSATGNGEGSTGSLGDSGAKRDVASAEGLVKDFNGELIGVRGDDIFKMMNRRYILKDKQDAFLNTATPAP